MYKIYQVEMGDTIESLSRKFGITNEELININGLTGPIMEGQLIIVPNTNNIFETYTIFNNVLAQSTLFIANTILIFSNKEGEKDV